MRGWVEKRGNSYRINIEVGRNQDGTRKYIRKTLKGVKKKVAEAELAKMLHEINTGIFVEPSKLTFAEYLDRWLPSHSKEKLSPMSTHRYKRDFKSLLSSPSLSDVVRNVVLARILIPWLSGFSMLVHSRSRNVPGNFTTLGPFYSRASTVFLCQFIPARFPSILFV